MKFFLLASIVLLAGVVSAAPQPDPLRQMLKRPDLSARDDADADRHDDTDNKHCLTAKRAQQVATNFRDLITNYTASLANATLTTDFTDYSAGVNELMDRGCPNGPVALNSPTFTSRAAFEGAQSGQPPIPFQQLNIWHTCHAVIIRWYSAQQPQIVTGIIVLETVPAPSGSTYQDLIKLVFSEFNSGAWLYNLGIFKPACN